MCTSLSFAIDESVGAVWVACGDTGDGGTLAYQSPLIFFFLLLL